jgi:hypothetical protein
VHRAAFILYAPSLACAGRAVWLAGLAMAGLLGCGEAFTSSTDTSDAGPLPPADATPEAQADTGSADRATLPKEAAPVNPNATIACSGEQCEPGPEVCCMQNSNDLPDFCVGGPGQPDKCTSDKATVTELACDDAEDCAKAGMPGICCAEARFNPDPSLTVWARVRCLPLSECLKPDDDVFCGSSDADCPPGKKCTKALGPYHLCE